MSQLISIKKNLINEQKINLLNFNRKNMRNFFISIGENVFRSNQVMQWMYHKYCDDFEKMTDLNKNLRNKLKKIAVIHAPEVLKELISIDGTIKWILKIDSQLIEMVYIPEKKRATLCISSQVGCALNCSFCFTAKQGFNRNLNVSEIIGQVWQAKKIIDNVHMKHPITNIVLMGMGEPCLNLHNVVPAIEIMLDHFGFHLSKRRITLSTAGIAPAIRKLKNMIDVRLAISLHAPNNRIRNTIMPINKKYNIKTVLESAKYYIEKSYANKKITIEYVMLYNINDQEIHAHELALLLKYIPCKINLIPWNTYPGAIYKNSSQDRMKNFFNILISYGFITLIRKTRGYDINAACGQLSGEIINRKKCIK